MTKRVIVTKRSDDYHAAFDARPEIWGAGKSIYEAVGNLVIAHEEEFGVSIFFRPTQIAEHT